MTAHQVLYEMQMERFEVFKTQDPENEHFDVVFEIKGKKLYANKFMICSISSTFNSMLSKRWMLKDEPIPIQEYSYDDFKQLLTFIYSGECSLTAGNIFAMVDIAEFYGIKTLKKVAENFITNLAMDIKNVFQMIEVANKYSLEKLKESVNRFVSQNLSTILKSEQIQGLEKSVVQYIVESSQEAARQDELFEAVYKWAEGRASEKLTNDINLNLNESIKEELSDFLPFINLQKMNAVFLIEFVVKKSFLFSGDELSDALSAQRKIVQIIDKKGNVMKGKLECDDFESFVRVILFQMDICSTRTTTGYYYWKTKQPHPTVPNKLIKNDKIAWYLIYDRDGDLAVKHRIQLVDNDDYLLAEMYAENEFEFSCDCKINVYKWAENRAAEKLKNDINFNLNESIKEDLSDFLPFINLQKMNVDFIIEFVVQKSFLFSGDDLSDALSAHRKCVKITDENGKKMTGELQCMDTRNVTAAIQSQKN
uniref:BTB domain-containing protein n=1 Tax=Panagrolaimus sp. ES5 TaxID=591445 RepID=A0AC34FV76_9BILA